MANKDFVVKNSLIVGDTATINGVQIDPSGATSGKVLKFDGTKFAPASEGDISGTVYTATIGDGTNSSYTITHGFGTRNVVVVIRNAASPYEVINVRWEATTTNTITVDFSSPVASESVIVSVYGAVTGSSISGFAPLASPTFTGTVTIPTGASITAPTGLVKGDVGLGSVDNTADTSKPVSTAQQTALDLKANLDSPALTGTPTAPTATAATNTTQVATTAFVRAEVAALVNSAGSTLDTLGEIATALGNDANLSTTLTTSIGFKAPLASPTFTGTVTIPSGASISGFAPLASPSLTGTPLSTTASAGTNTTQIATTAFVTTAVSVLDNIGDVTIAQSYAIGDTGPAGGKIFITPSTSGNSTGKYFEAAPFLNPDVTRSWATNVNSNQTTAVSGADGLLIGTGEQNTIDIVAQSGNVAATCAAAYASDYTYGGFSDWFLPSRSEAYELYTNRASLDSFSSTVYWTSSENTASTAWYQGIPSGSQMNNSKSGTFGVRPVRSFATVTSDDILKWNGSAWVNDNALLAAKAPLASPTFTGTPTLPTGTIATTQAAADSTTKVATTAFVTTADNLKANLASPTFTGTVVLPATTSIGTISSTELGYVNGVTSAIQTQFSAKANLASPTFTGTPTLPTGTIATTQTAADSTTKVATTAFVTTADNLKANIASPTFTGTVTIPSGASISGFAPLASPALTGTPTAPTAAANTNTTQVATTAFVTTALSTVSADIMTDAKNAALLVMDIGS